MCVSLCVSWSRVYGYWPTRALPNYSTDERKEEEREVLARVFGTVAGIIRDSSAGKFIEKLEMSNELINQNLRCF